jgi:3-oxoadipate enol-lactonase
MPLTHVNNVDLYYELHGPENADVIVLSNGIFMSTASWGFQIAALKQHFRVLVYDCRGMWQSEHPAGPYSMEQHADDLAALLQGLGIEKAHIAGISYGGEISMVFAVQHPEMTRSLIVSSSVSHIEPLLHAIGESWQNALARQDGGLVFSVTLPYNFSEQWLQANQAILPNTRARYDQLDCVSGLALMNAFMEFNFTDQLHRITAPTLVLVGEQDILKTPHYAHIIANNIPGAELVEIPDAGHAVCLEKPGAFNSAFLGFLLKHSEVVA